MSGGLARAAWPDDEARDFVENVALTAGDEEWRERGRTVDSTVRRLDAEGKAQGWPTLATLIDPRVVDKVREWLGIRRDLAGSPATPKRDAGATTAEPILTPFATLQPRAVEWLWPDRFPSGKLTLLVGDPGLGKSLTTLDVAARVSTGAAWPDGSGAPTAGAILLISGEDDAADTVLPRFLAAGGDPKQATMLIAVSVLVGSGDLETRKNAALSLDVHLDAVEQAITRTGAVLVVIDPLSAYLGRADSHIDAEIRGVLMPLAALAERTGAAILAVMHLNKRAAGPALYRPGGSIAFIAAARAAHVITRDPDDPSGLKRLFLPLKENLSVPAAGLVYTVEAATVHADDGAAIATARVVWQAGTVATTATQALAAGDQDGAETSALDDAKDLLRELLANGAVSSKEVKAAARQAGVADRTLYRAKTALAIKATKGGFDGAWSWTLPESERPTQECQPGEERQQLHGVNVGNLGSTWQSSADRSAVNGRVDDDRESFTL